MESDVTQESATQAKPFDPTQMLHSHRIYAMSVRGDLVWQICQPVLEFLIDNGDELAQGKAIETRAYWEQGQKWLIDILNKNYYFVQVQRAMQDVRGYRKALGTLPPGTSLTVEFWPDGATEPVMVDAFAYLALEAAERVLRKLSIRGKRVKRK